MSTHSKGAMASRPAAWHGHSRTGSPFNDKEQEQVSAGTHDPLTIYLKNSQVYLQEKLPALIAATPIFPKWQTFKRRGYVDLLQQV